MYLKHLQYLLAYCEKCCYLWVDETVLGAGLSVQVWSLLTVSSVHYFLKQASSVNIAANNFVRQENYFFLIYFGYNINPGLNFSKIKPYLHPFMSVLYLILHVYIYTSVYICIYIYTHVYKSKPLHVCMYVYE